MISGPKNFENRAFSNPTQSPVHRRMENGSDTPLALRGAALTFGLDCGLKGSLPAKTWRTDPRQNRLKVSEAFEE